MKVSRARMIRLLPGCKNSSQVLTLAKEGVTTHDHLWIPNFPLDPFFFFCYCETVKYWNVVIHELKSLHPARFCSNTLQLFDKERMNCEQKWTDVVSHLSSDALPGDLMMTHLDRWEVTLSMFIAWLKTKEISEKLMTKTKSWIF